MIGDRRHRRPVRLPAPRHRARRAAARSARSWRPRTPQIGDGAKVPHLSYVGDADDRRGHQHRRRHDLRQLRRGAQAPHDGRQAREDRVEQHVRRAGRRSATARSPAAARWCAATCPPGALAVSSGPAAQHRGLGARKAGRARAGRGGGRTTPRAGGATIEDDGVPETSGRTSATARDREEQSSVSGMKRTTEKNLMVFTGRAHPELAEEVAEHPRHRPGADRRRTTSPTARSTSATRSRCAAATRS